MIFKIVLKDTNKSYNDMYEQVGTPVHESLVGNSEYIDSNIILSMDEQNGEPVCVLMVLTNECKDKEYIREKLKMAIDLFIDAK